MSFDQALFMFLPLATGLAIPAILNRRGIAPDRLRRVALIAAAAVTVGLLPLLFLAALLSAPSLAAVLPAWLYLTSYHLLLIVLFLFLRRLGIGPTGCQVILSLAVVLTMGAIFAADPLFVAVEPMGPEAVHRTASILIAINPWMVVGGSILQTNPLQDEFFYKPEHALSYYKITYPAWWSVALWQTGMAALLILILAIRARFFSREGASPHE